MSGTCLARQGIELLSALNSAYCGAIYSPFRCTSCRLTVDTAATAIFREQQALRPTGAFKQAGPCIRQHGVPGSAPAW